MVFWSLENSMCTFVSVPLTYTACCTLYICLKFWNHSICTLIILNNQQSPNVVFFSFGKASYTPNLRGLIIQSCDYNYVILCNESLSLTSHIDLIVPMNHRQSLPEASCHVSWGLFHTAVAEPTVQLFILYQLAVQWVSGQHRVRGHNTTKQWGGQLSFTSRLGYCSRNPEYSTFH